MTADKDNIVDKRVSGRVIRRRKKKTETALPEEAQQAEEAQASTELAEVSSEPVAVEAAEQETKIEEKLEPIEELVQEKVSSEEPKAEIQAKEEIPVKAPKAEKKEAAPPKPESGKETGKKVFPDREQASPEQIQRAVEESRAKSKARRVGRPAAPGEPAKHKQERTFGPSTKKTEVKVETPSGQSPVKKDTSRLGKKRLRKEASFQSKKDKEKEQVFNRRSRKKKFVLEEEQKQTEITVPKASKRVVKINEMILIGELARSMSIKSGEIIKKLMDLGVMATLNQSIDLDTAQIVASEFGYEVVNEAFQEEELINTTEEDKPDDLVSRAPIVTVMGHVDHGKTTLLDAIRKTKVVDTEAGGITQHIGAYQVKKTINKKEYKIVFIDTPGHEAFTAMRARGAQVTDLAIVVVAADDGIMPQTVEAINHAKAAGVPIMIAINKIDRPDANVDKIKQSLTEFELVAEEWGGTTIMHQVSALKGTGIDSLLELIALQTEILELKANPKRNLKGVVIEGKLEKGRGPVATIIVKNGTVKIGDQVVCGVYSGRVRALANDLGSTITEAGPSTPVELLGLDGVPKAGDDIHVVESERISKEISNQRARKERDAELMKSSKVSLEDLYKRIEAGNVMNLNVILKTDVQGTVDAILGGLEKLSTDKVKVKVIHGSVGAITESDVNLAISSDALIIGFNIRPSRQVIEMALSEKVSIKTYTVIYELLDEVRDAMEGLLAPTEEERYHSRVQIRQIFAVSRIGTIAGCYVQDGKVQRNDSIRLLRDNVVIYEGKLASLKRFKDDAKEVAAGYECGLSIENFNDIKVDDELETYVIEKVAAKL